MSESLDAARAAQWLGIAAVDGARVGPFELVSSEAREGAEEGTFDVYVDGFDEPLAFGVSAADADALTRRFMASIAEWDIKLRVASRSSFPPPGSSFPPPGSSRRSSSSHRSKRSSTRAKRRLPRMAVVLLFLGVVAALSGFAYYFGTTHPPDTTEPPRAPE